MPRLQALTSRRKCTSFGPTQLHPESRDHTKNDRVEATIAHLGWIKVWNGRDPDVRPKVVVLSDVRAFVRFMYIVQEGGFACDYVDTTRAADKLRKTNDDAAPQEKVRNRRAYMNNAIGNMPSFLTRSAGSYANRQRHD